MSGLTPRGLPYPSGTDKVRNGANDIAALALAVDPFLVVQGWRYQFDTSALSIPTGVWTKASTTTEEETAGTGVTPSGGGVYITTAGLFIVEAFIEWAAAAAGVRLIGVGNQGDTGPNTYLRLVAPGPAVSGSVVQAATWTRRFAVGTILHLFVQQNTGAALNITTRRLGVRRVQM